MQLKNRSILILCIVLILFLGSLSSFSFPFFKQSNTIVLPDLTDLNETQNLPIGHNDYHSLIQVNCDTVKFVIESLERQQSYYRELTIDLFWNDSRISNASTSTILIWNDNEYSKTAVMTPDGTLQNYLNTIDTIYLWYGSDKNWFKYNNANDEVDIAQQIPTYEDIIKLDDASIVDANYQTKSGKPCIYVECFIDALQYTERYWVSVESGLLVYAETEYDGEITYRMQEKLVTTLEEDNTPFTLPDGTLLHSVVTFETEEKNNP